MAKFFRLLPAFILLAFAIAIGIHFVRSYERSIAKRVDVAATIPEGSTVYDIDRILSDAGVISRGDLIAANASTSLEGKLFPDTYNFFPSSTASAVIQKFSNNFEAKAAPLFAVDEKNAERDLTIASILEKEVASSTDRAIVAGIILKRLDAGMALNVDATLCYAKQIAAAGTSCYPLTPADFQSNSPYNTYTHQGLPPTPISNPGVDAIQAALHPQASPYWYYLSDPKTGKTIYAKTLEQQNANRRKYLP